MRGQRRLAPRPALIDVFAAPVSVDLPRADGLLGPSRWFTGEVFVNVPTPGSGRWPARLQHARRRAGRLAHTAPIPMTSPLYAVVATTFHITAGLAAIGVAWLVPATRYPVWISLIGACGIASAFSSARTSGRISFSQQRFVYFLGPPFVALMVVLAGPNSAGHALYWLFCFMPLRAFLFFSWRWALAMGAWAGLSSAIVTFGFGIVGDSEWWVSSSVGIVTMVAVSALVYYAAEAEWEPITQMLNRRGIDRLMAESCLEANQSGRSFSLALVRAEPPGHDTSEPRPDADAFARKLAERWLPAPPNVHWGRIADFEFAVVWDGPSTGLDEYLTGVRDAVEWARFAIGFADHHRGDERVTVLGAAYEGRAFSALTGGAVTRAGPIEEQVDELRAALDAGQIVAYYQPIVDLDSGAVVGAEALARWRHPERGFVPPDRFVPLAEHAGLVDRLGEAVLRQACRDAAAWYGPGGRPPMIAVNVSGCQLHAPGFVGLVDEVLAETGLASSQLTLEITESTVAADDKVVLDALVRLRSRGVRIAIDDFGTGYSSAARLMSLPVDELKVDQEFVRQLDSGHPILQYMLALATSTGLCAIVEGIERADQAAAVSAFGATLAQGWLFGPAVPNAEFVLAHAEPGAAARPLDVPAWG
jgi:EAL domain-containing protein (putative c-di-GMP-specific phosphodiesterase class I)